MILGVVFLAGVMIFEWGLFPSIYQAHLTPWGSKYGAVVFAMTGMHAFHVITGIGLIFIMWNLARKPSLYCRAAIGVSRLLPFTGTTSTWSGSSSIRHSI